LHSAYSVVLTRRSAHRGLALLGAAWLASFATPAHAVVPGLFQPLQQLMAVLPGILAMAFAGVLLWFGSVRRFIGHWARVLIRRPKLAGALAVVIAVAVPGYVALSTRGVRAAADSGPTNADWPCFRGNIARTGHVDDVAPPKAPRVIWKFRELLPTDHEPFSSSPAVADGKVYAASWGGVLYCFDAATGERKWTWKSETGIPIHSSPAVANGRVYVGEGLHMDGDCSLYCIAEDAQGQPTVLWKYTSTSHMESSAQIVDGKLYTGAGDDGVLCLNADTGELIWQYAGVHSDCAPLVADGRCYFGTAYSFDAPRRLIAVDAGTGAEIWHVDYEYDVWGAPAADGDFIYVGIGNGNVDISDENPYGEVQCVEAATGNIVWSFKPKDSVLGAVAVSDGKVFAGSRDGNLYALDAKTGAQVFAFATSSPDDPKAIVSSPAVTDGQVIFGCEDGKLRGIDAASGQLVWEFDAGSLDSLAPTDARILPSPAVAGGRVYVGSDNFFFFCVGDAA